MAINAEYVGREYPPFGPYLVGREKLREFAEAVASQQDIHFDVTAARAAGFDDVVAPVTFAVVVAQRAESQLIEDPEANIDFTRVVHAEEKFTHHRAIVAGDELTTVLHVDNVIERSGLSMVTTRCEISDAVGKPVSTVISTLAVRGEAI